MHFNSIQLNSYEIKTNSVCLPTDYPDDDAADDDDDLKVVEYLD